MDLVHVVLQDHLKPRSHRGIDFNLDTLLEGEVGAFLINYTSRNDVDWGPILQSKNVRVYGDSGGLQNARDGREIDPVDVSEWYNRNVDIGMLLDKIPIEFDGPRMSDRKWLGGNTKLLRKCAEQSAENARAMARVKNGYELLYIYQGWTWDELSVWDEHSDLSVADGLAFGYQRDYRNILLKLLYVYENHYGENVHFLGVGGPTSYTPLVLFDHYWPGRVSCDSARASWIARNRTVYSLMFGMQKTTLRGDEAALYEDGLPCICPYCEVLQEHPNTLVEKDPRTDKSSFTSKLLIAHNMWVEERRAEFLQRMVHNWEAFRAFCSVQMGHVVSDGAPTNHKMGLLDCLDGIQTLFEEGSEAFRGKYRVGVPQMEEWF